MSRSLGSTHVRASAAGSFAPLASEDYEKQHQQPSSPEALLSDRSILFLERLRSSRNFTLVLFTVVVVLLFSDQCLVSPNLSAIAAEFGFSDEEKDRKLGGDIAIAFFGFGAPASLFVGWLADFVDRRRLFVAIVLVGEMGALSTVFTTTYSQLYWTRALTGIAIGGGMPLVFAIMADLVGSSRRTEASGAIGIAIGCGQGTGQLVAGFTGHGTSLGWRLPFLLVSVPCLLLAVLVLVATRDPPRGRLEKGLQGHFEAGGEYTERPSLRGLRLLAGSPTVVMALLQGVPGCIPWSVMSVYLTDFLHKQRGMTVERGTLVGFVFGLGSVLGQLGGAKIGQNLYNRRAALQPVLMGVTTMAGTLPSLMLIRYTGGLFAAYVVYAFTGGVLAAVTGPNIKAVLMNTTLPSTRGTAFGVFNLFDDLGKGLGPALVSLLVVSRGRESAFTLAFMAWFVCGVLLLAMTCCVAQDESKVQAHLAEYARNNSAEKKGSAQSPLSLSMTMKSTGTAKYATVTGNSLDTSVAEAARFGWEEEEEEEGRGEREAGIGGGSREGVEESFGVRGGGVAMGAEEPRRKLLERREDGPAS